MRAGRGHGFARWLTAFALVVALAACVTHRHRRQILVLGDDSVEQKRARAAALVTEQRCALLKTQLKERLPAVNDAQLAGLGLRWSQTYFKSFSGENSRTTVSVMVEMRTDGSFDAEPIVKTAIAILDPELNPPGTTAPDGA